MSMIISSPVLVSKTERKICCEVFAYRNGTFTLICKFCRNKFHTFSAFSIHLSEKHSPEPLTTTIKSENSCDDDDSSAPQPLEDCAAECFLFEEKPEPNKQLDDTVPPRSERIKRKRKVDAENLTQQIEDCAAPAAQCIRFEVVKPEPKQIEEPAAARPERVKPKKNVPISKKATTSKKGKSTPTIHKCSYCGKIFSSKRLRVDHENYIHTGQNPYKCDECPSTFATSMSFYRHRDKHKGNLQRMCSHCGQMCSKPSKLAVHIREKHLPDTDPRRFFTCTTCDRKFKTAHQLYDHKTTHKENRPSSYTCDYCQQSYKTKTYIYQHMMAIHMKVKNTHPCRFCPKMFKTIVVRDGHENTHTGIKPYQCKLCPKEFMTPVSLRRHNKTHANDGAEKPPAPVVRYQCSIPLCTKTFLWQKNRDKHVNSHMGILPNRCQLCPKEYQNLNHLSRHIKVAHGGTANAATKKNQQQTEDDDDNNTNNISSFILNKL